MSESRLRLIKQLSSSIFSNKPEENWFRPSRKMTRDSSNSFVHGSRDPSPTSPYLKPVDHLKSDFYSLSPSEYFRKDITGIYESPVIKAKKVDFFDKINNLPVKNSSTNRLNLSRPGQNSLSSSQNFEPCKSRSSSPKPMIRPKLDEARLETISILGLPGDQVDLKAFCRGMHVVNISNEVDNLTGKHLGKATISIRSNDSKQLETLKYRLLNQGFQVSAISARPGKKNNFHTAGIHFLNSKLQQEEKRLNGDSLSSKERKLALLSSNEDLFGNTRNRFQGLSDRSFDLKESRRTSECLRMWKLTRSVCIKSPSAKGSVSMTYSRPTISSCNKTVKRV